MKISDFSDEEIAGEFFKRFPEISNIRLVGPAGLNAKLQSSDGQWYTIPLYFTNPSINPAKVLMDLIKYFRG